MSLSALCVPCCRDARLWYSRFQFERRADSISFDFRLGRKGTDCSWNIPAGQMGIMDKKASTASEVISELSQFAKENGYMLAQADCLSAHAEKCVDLGHCPCVDLRASCPCEEVQGDMERLGRCECGILIDPVRLSSLKRQRISQE
ncbi:MAG: hypothetical protein KAQ74_00485 [Dehalococcoidia bacterium]|nr:hypothetical protein [Dehalococcoidia bacterium]